MLQIAWISGVDFAWNGALGPQKGKIESIQVDWSQSHPSWILP
jgi:hypothetical protein